MTTQATMTAEDVRQLYEKVKTWGRWGADDERGALNLITPEKRQQAAALIQRGITVSASLPMAKAVTPENPFPVTHLMVRGGDIREFGSAADYFAMAPHGMAHTHLDALCHFFDEGLLYNGFPQERVTSMGTQVLSIESGADGIVSRGVLLDVPRAKGREWLEPGEPIFPEDLDKAEEMAGLRVEQGDILLLRTGRHRRAKEVGPWNGRETLAGMYGSCLEWLSSRDIALLGCDGVSDVLPSLVEGIRQPIHVGTLVYMGVHLLDNADLEPLANACAQYSRWEFFFSINPLKLGQGTASPVNPIAIF